MASLCKHFPIRTFDNKVFPPVYKWSVYKQFLKSVALKAQEEHETSAQESQREKHCILGTSAKLSAACYFIMLIEQPLSPMTMNNWAEQVPCRGGMQSEIGVTRETRASGGAIKYAKWQESITANL